MKTIRFCTAILLLSLFASAAVLAKSPSFRPLTNVSVADSSENPQLDAAVDALNKGDKAASSQALQAGIANLEAQAQAQPTSFKDKILAQVSKLKALLPLISSGMLGGGALSKAVSLAKLASGGSKLESIMSAGSLIGKGSQLTSGLSGISSALGGLGGSASSGQSLITTAMSTVSKLDQGGMAAKAAETAAKSQLGGVLNLVKGVL